MKLNCRIGTSEFHDLEVAWNVFSGKLAIIVDGKVRSESKWRQVVEGTSITGFPLCASEFNIGNQEVHSVRIVPKNKAAFTEVYVDGKKTDVTVTGVGQDRLILSLFVVGVLAVLGLMLVIVRRFGLR